MIDVKGRRCEVVHCTKIAGYGVQGRQPSACLLHRESGMVDMKQHRPRLGSGKPGSINVNLGSGGAAAAAAESSASSFAKWGRRSRKNLYGVPGGSNGVILTPSSQSAAAVAAAGGMDSASGLDLMRLARHANNPSGSQQWHSDAGYSSGVSSQSGGQALRSWVMGGNPQPFGGGGGSGPGVPTVGMWAFNHPSSGTAPSSRGAQNSAGEGSGGGMQHPSSHWAPSQENVGSQGNEGSHYPGPHESGASNGTVGRGSSSLSAETGGGRFSGGGGSYGNDGGGGGGSGERDGGGAWRSGAPGASGFNEGFHQQFSGSGQGVDQNGYAIVPSLSGGRSAGGGGGGDAVSGGPSSSKSEHGPNSEVGIVDVETEDIWLRDLMQGTMTRESQQNGGGGAADMPHSSVAAGFQRSAASHTASGSQHYPRHLGPGSSAGTGDHAPSSRSGTPSSSSTAAAAALAEDRRFYQGQQQQHRQQQHSQQRQQSSHSGSGSGGGSGSSDQVSRPAQHYDAVRDPVLSVTSGGRFKEAMNANARAKGLPVNMTMGRSPSTASNGASPPHDSGSPTDAMPPRHVGGSKHDGVGGGASVAAGGGGGNPGVGSNGFMSRSSARGAGPPNHLFTSLSAMAGHDGGGYGMGLNSDMQLMAASRVTSPSWGGV